MRKTFEPRMAHSATTVGNYILVFGGFNSQNKNVQSNNFCVLSLTGCSDYMLQKPRPISMVRDHQSKRSIETDTADGRI